jgi:hypothetical protein
MSPTDEPSFPQYQPPASGIPVFSHPKQQAPLMKVMNKMLKMPKKKVLQRRNRVVRKKYTIV